MTRHLSHPLAGLLLSLLFLIPACSDNDPVAPPHTIDYYPFSKGTVWTYRTNLFKEHLDSIVTMDVKIDTSSNSNGVFDFLMLRVPPDYPDWQRVLSVLDSAGTVYSLGDHPPEALIPLFKHQYEENEITHETITINGTTYETVKYTVDLTESYSVSWWFADGIGLVREHSMTGVSLFNDDNTDEVLTELVSYTR